ncbi:MAG: outer membrane lipoprotein-sorting protein, partial [Deltaproteobacteria bacterium]
LELKAKKGVDVAYPVLHMWIDAATGNMLKRQDFALSGRLMRTTYYPKWKKVFSESKGSEVYYPEQIRIFDEVEKGNKTTVVITSVDLKSLDANIFTKAWLESKSR